MIRILSFHLIAAMLLIVVPASAADQKPDIVLKAKYTEVKVSFDDAVKADAPLLKNVTAEGKLWAQKGLKELIQQRKDLGTDVDKEYTTRPWEMERSYSRLSLVLDRYVSILRFDYQNVGGAHPSYDQDTILWDRRAGKRISIRPFFNETADDGPTMKAMQQAAIAGVRIAKKDKGIENVDEGDWQGNIGASLLRIGPVALHPSTIRGKSSGLMIHYAPYAVGPWAEGVFEAFIPWETLKPYLSAEGTAIFGGTRPPDAGDKPK
jgi:hypothetical protein